MWFANKIYDQKLEVNYLCNKRLYKNKFMYTRIIINFLVEQIKFRVTNPQYPVKILIYFALVANKK